MEDILYHYCAVVPLDADESVYNVATMSTNTTTDDDNFTDTSLCVSPSSPLYSTMINLMTCNKWRTVLLATPRSPPTTFNSTEDPIPYHTRFPTEFVVEMNGLLSQGGGHVIALTKNRKKPREPAEVTVYDGRVAYHSVLLSFFVQAVRQINPHAMMLYRMVNAPIPAVKDRRRNKLIPPSETSSCCFNRIIVTLCKGFYSARPELRIHVANHVRHSGVINLSAVSEWFGCEHSMQLLQQSIRDAADAAATTPTPRVVDDDVIQSS